MARIPQLTTLLFTRFFHEKETHNSSWNSLTSQPLSLFEAAVCDQARHVTSEAEI